jgi:hypothetical protein
MRTYPHGLRVSSTNLDPSIYWRKGVQMVALNWQKWDRGMMLNEGMFAGEGGWVLKPEGYRSISSREIFMGVPGTSQADSISYRTLNLKIMVFAGRDIPLPEGDEDPKRFHPYLKCELHVEKAEEKGRDSAESGGKSKGGKHKNRTQSQKGVNPDFHNEVLEFAGAERVVEELSFLRSVCSVRETVDPKILRFLDAAQSQLNSPSVAYSVCLVALIEIFGSQCLLRFRDSLGFFVLTSVLELSRAPRVFFIF